MAHINMEEIYRDQAIECVNLPGYQFMAALTPYGIKKLDSQFCHRIMAFLRGESFTEYSWSCGSPYEPRRAPIKEVERVWNDTHESLTKDITENPHLHLRIKENLLFNLNQ